MLFSGLIQKKPNSKHKKYLCGIQLSGLFLWAILTEAVATPAEWEVIKDNMRAGENFTDNLKEAVTPDNSRDLLLFQAPLVGVKPVANQSHPVLTGFRKIPNIGDIKDKLKEFAKSKLPAALMSFVVKSVYDVETKVAQEVDRGVDKVVNKEPWLKTMDEWVKKYSVFLFDKPYQKSVVVQLIHDSNVGLTDRGVTLQSGVDRLEDVFIDVDSVSLSGEWKKKAVFTDAVKEAFSKFDETSTYLPKVLAIQIKGKDKNNKYFRQRVMALHIVDDKGYLIFQPYDLNPNDEEELAERKAHPKYYAVQFEPDDRHLETLFKDLFNLPWAKIDLDKSSFEVRSLMSQ